MIKIWGRTNAFSVQKVLWLIHELDLPYELIPSGGPHGSLGSPEFLLLNPTAKLPVIEDDAQVVWESNTILRYLAARHGQGRFWSNDPFERSQAERWMDWSLAALEPAFMKLFWGYYRTPEERRDAKFINSAIAECAAAFGILDEVLKERPYLGGKTPSIGDIAAGASLYRYFSLKIEQPSLPNVRKWYGRLGEQSAYQTAVMVPFEELRGRIRN